MCLLRCWIGSVRPTHKQGQWPVGGLALVLMAAVTVIMSSVWLFVRSAQPGLLTEVSGLYDNVVVR